MADKESRSLALWDPFADLESRARWPFHSVAHPADLQGNPWGPPGRGFAPAVDVAENEAHYMVTAELPGAKKSDVTVELHAGMLTIRGEKRSEREEKGEHRRLVERSFGAFSRSFSLPANADGEHIKAKFEDGVLRVEVPKIKEAKPKTVNIKG